jgi:hypothetical protein
MASRPRKELSPISCRSLRPERSPLFRSCGAVEDCIFPKVEFRDKALCSHLSIQCWCLGWEGDYTSLSKQKSCDGGNIASMVQIKPLYCTVLTTHWSRWTAHTGKWLIFLATDQFEAVRPTEFDDKLQKMIIQI